MKTLTALDGVILTCHESGESDRILIVLTQQLGKLAIIQKKAKNGGKKFFQQAEPFESAVFEVSTPNKSDLYRLIKITPTDTPRNIRKEITAYIGLCFCSEVIQLTTLPQFASDGDKVTLFKDLISVVDELAKASEDSEKRELKKSILKECYAFLRIILKGQGILPEDFSEKGSAKNLVVMANIVAESTNKQIRSFNSLLKIIQTLKS
jgi:recombinational DNA repair protein (RecF pathway)